MTSAIITIPITQFMVKTRITKTITKPAWLYVRRKDATAFFSGLCYTFQMVSRRFSKPWQGHQIRTVTSIIATFGIVQMLIT